MSQNDDSGPVLDPLSIEPRTSTVYPHPHDRATEGRAKRSLTQALGLTQFGVNITELAPQSASSLRHWHSHEDEFIYVIEGRPTLVQDGGSVELAPGMTAGFPAGAENGHKLVNNTDEPVVVLEVGTRSDEDEAFYPDIDMRCAPGRYQKAVFTKANGDPWT